MCAALLAQRAAWLHQAIEYVRLGCGAWAVAWRL